MGDGKNGYVLLCAHLKNDVFPISLPSPLKQGNTLSLTNLPQVKFIGWYVHVPLEAGMLYVHIC